MFDSLSDKLQDIIAKTAGQKELTQDNMQEALREIRRALLEADVNLRVVKAFIDQFSLIHCVFSSYLVFFAGITQLYRIYGKIAISA